MRRRGKRPMPTWIMAWETSQRSSSSRTSRRQRLIQPNDLSMTHRRGSTWKPCWPAKLRTIDHEIAVGRRARQLAMAIAPSADRCLSHGRRRRMALMTAVRLHILYVGGVSLVKEATFSYLWRRCASSWSRCFSPYNGKLR